MSYPLSLICLIPARLESSRFFGKPLAEINGRAMITRVYDLAHSCGYFKEIYIVTPNQKIWSHCKEFDIPVLPTPPSPNDCIDCAAMGAEALLMDVSNGAADRYVILQGDEPLFNCQILEQLDYSAECINLFTSMKNELDYTNPNIVKVLIGEYGRAIYYSRLRLPHINSDTNRNQEPVRPYKQLGVYIFSLNMLRKFHSLDPSFLECAEGVGLNRFISHDIPIQMQYSPIDSISVDIPSDIEKIEEILRQR